MVIRILLGTLTLPTKYQLFSLLFMANYSFIMTTLKIGILQDLLRLPVSLHALYIPLNRSFWLSKKICFGLRRQLEESGVLNGALKPSGSPWALHMPDTCVHFVFRLAPKAFTDQKRRFFPHLDDEVPTHLHDGR
jgi:hypothetical protein